MITIRKSEARGHANHGWLDSYHSFSFANYYDPQHMGYRKLLVINEDKIEPSQGFPTHPHRDMEIISYVLEGELEHKDSMGNGSTIAAGDVQKMSAGTGIRHSEFNPSSQNKGHFLQIWIEPSEKGIIPAYEQKHFSKNEKLNNLLLIVSPEKSEKTIHVVQDAKIYASILEKNKDLSFPIHNKRGVWIQLIQGKISVNDQIISTGDAIAAENENLKITALEESEFLLFDLA